jgi:soluble lytic murein transglycosylase-like protein
MFVLTIGYMLAFAGYKHYTQVKEDKAYQAQQVELSNLKEKYSFTINDIYVEATSAEEALQKTKALLVTQAEETTKQININKEQQETIVALQEKYDAKIEQAKATTKQDVKLYNEYAYAIEYPGSDMTLSDIKMIVNISKEEKVNPHLWLSLVELESKFKSNARSNRSTASGWGQVLKGTGESLYEDQLKLGNYNHASMGINKEINAKMSIHYLGELINTSGSIERALINYNGGELGEKYANIVKQNLKENTGLTLSKVTKPDPI